MADVFTLTKRREIMRRIRGRDTAPEMTVRRLVHALGYRYRLHMRDLPGKPDLVFASRRRVILVHGCFWHRHCCRKGRSLPATRRRFWQVKLSGNQKRDSIQRRALQRLGWSVLIVWECQTTKTAIISLADRIRQFLREAKHTPLGKEPATGRRLACCRSEG
jgi:DNA mismatch endonuclease (patch repair protein)